MTFEKLRKSLGNRNLSNDRYHLNRFCNKINTNVIGGASKLLKYFIRNYSPELIISYADRRYSNGNLYEKLGFERIGESRPNYWYIKGQKRHYRFKFRKDILIKEGFDSNLTEREIMLERGYLRIYDCGNIKYEYVK